jgi:hypothetical protein
MWRTKSDVDAVNWLMTGKNKIPAHGSHKLLAFAQAMHKPKMPKEYV